MKLAERELTADSLWHLALCNDCGQPFKLRDLKQLAKDKGVELGDGCPQFYVYCHHEPGFKDDEQYLAVVALLRRFYGL